MRGYGDAAKPAFGDRIRRLTKDVGAVLRALDLNDVAILGHSMVCAVHGCSFDLFGADRGAKFVVCDESPMLTSNPAWSAPQVEGSRLEIFEEAEGGQHFMLVENPVQFNRIVAKKDARLADAG